MFIDDLSFDGEYPGVSGDPGAEAAAKAFAFWNRQAQMRHAQEAKMSDDIRTQRLVKLLSIANTLTHINGEINNLILSAENDEGALKLLQVKIQHAEEYADLIRRDYEASMDAA